MLIKQKSPSLPRNLAFKALDELLVVLSTKVNKSAIPPLFNGPKVLSSASDKVKNCLLKSFLRTLILMTQVSLYVFSILELI